MDMMLDAAPELGGLARPPTPRLGDFSRVFATWLTDASDNVPANGAGRPNLTSPAHASPSPPSSATANESTIGPADYGEVVLLTKGRTLLPLEEAYNNLPSGLAAQVFTGSSQDAGRRASSNALTPPADIPPGGFGGLLKGLAFSGLSPLDLSPETVGSPGASDSSTITGGYYQTETSNELSSEERFVVVKRPAVAIRKPKPPKPRGVRESWMAAYSSSLPGFPKHAQLFFADPPFYSGSPYSLKPIYCCRLMYKDAVLKWKLDQLEHDATGLRGMPSSDVYIFVDLSNIIIGFYNQLKINRGLSPTARVKAPPFSFRHFHMVLERGRHAAKKILAGSVLSADPRMRPDYMKDAAQMGYEMNILQRVPRQATSSPPKRRGYRVDWTTSGADTSGDEFNIGAVKNGEQAVDEILHLKMANSILDHAPATMVLATGDAADGEFSDGFKASVERALNNGWNVEVLAWSKNTSSAWKDADFQEHWKSRFRLIQLDDFAEELFAKYL